MAKCKDYEFDPVVECPTLNPEKLPVADARLVQRSFGLATISMLDTIDTPSEYLACVTVRCVVKPNSAPEWGSFRNQPSCTQVMFFDVRRSPRALHNLIASGHLLHHKATDTGNGARPSYATAVKDKDTFLCECAKRGCPGEASRNALWRRRLGCTRRQKANVAIPPNRCFLSSIRYDLDLTDAIAEQEAALEALSVSSDSRSKDDDDDDALDQDQAHCAAAYRNWVLFDGDSGHPFLPDECDANPYDDQNPDAEEDELVYEALDRDGRLHRWHRLSFRRSLISQAESYLSLRPCDADQMIDAVHQSDHCAALCAQAPLRKSINKLASSTDVLRARNRGTEIDLDEEERGPVRRALADLCDAANDDVRCEHKFGTCQCIIEERVRQCTWQLTLDMVAAPGNHVYPLAGDSIYKVRSPMLRMRAAFKAERQRDSLSASALALLNSIAGEGENDEHAREKTPAIDECAQPGEPAHYDSVVQADSFIRTELELMFGEFGYVRFGDEVRVVARNTADNDFEFAFAAHFLRARRGSPSRSRAARTYNAEQQLPELSSAKLGASEWERYRTVLERCREHAGAPDSIETMAELALWRGWFGESERIERRLARLPEAVRRMVGQVYGFERDVELIAREILEEPKNKRRIVSSTSEMMIVNEMLQCHNARLVVARTVAPIFHAMQTLEQWRNSTCHVVCVLAIIDMVVEYHTLPPSPAEQRAKAEEAERRRREQEEKRRRRREEKERREREEAERRERVRAERRRKRETKRARKEAERQRKADEERRRAEQEAERLRDEKVDLPPIVEDWRAVGTDPRAADREIENAVLLAKGLIAGEHKCGVSTWAQLSAWRTLAYV